MKYSSVYCFTNPPSFLSFLSNTFWNRLIVSGIIWRCWIFWFLSCKVQEVDAAFSCSLGQFANQRWVFAKRLCWSRCWGAQQNEAARVTALFVQEGKHYWRLCILITYCLVQNQIKDRFLLCYLLCGLRLFLLSLSISSTAQIYLNRISLI